MKSKKLKFVVTAIAITLVAGLFAGCGNSDSSNNASNNSSASTQGVSGSITVSGSTALQPLAEKSIEGFNKKNPDATVNVQGGGSGTGLTQVSQGAVDIGNSDVAAEEKLDAATAKTLVDHKVCAIGFAVVTSKDVDVTDLTKAQIQDIFTGKVKNWKDVGGKDLAINVVHRTSGSGTRATFTKTVLDGNKEKDDIGTTQDSNGAVKAAMTKTPGSISYLALSYLNDEVKNDIKELKIGGVEASKENITTGKYPFWSYEHMYTKEEPTGVSKAFIEYITSDENKKLIEKLGYIASSDMKVK
ncbi:phosphate-binding protein PstS 1 [Clostridium pasteurianum DSM 525 = ATCC 6013]|uniref:phosphate ABC transporter substrate-binding protein n=1 Tax=Clostridium pasteurianum TaxID=1501 RepID=UPI000559A60F|nr:phosphate ABC transporter substrate-binding protein [Clostridium pasteurianum]AJA48194.1 phosphate-binding protein PstS 1 [Clostridium pasteurianum DSM 525 = ATCC 6013]OMH22337.1 phosphate ABC transporter substrate-binding protein [Clostridium pasteurianum]